ncbi:hypothetical protein AYI68_g3931 [Smittium mucronatum]|uniref:Uncharacterized protein n=1 Tax=Smittium mucronatum TaxID=133383 RepID=A0A1R0GYJ0_9FUNG|nr:hypothetical protein AYI68_g3931 [Smittium mucronatum]
MLLYQATGHVPRVKWCNLPTERPPLLLDAEVRLIVERWTFALDYVSVVLNDRFLLFRDGPPLESLFSESLCAVSTSPTKNNTTLIEFLV